MENLKKHQLLKLIDNLNGKIFNVKFIKKSTGELRSMTCRTNVKFTNQSGQPLHWNQRERGIVPVYELTKKQYKSFDIRKSIWEKVIVLRKPNAI